MLYAGSLDKAQEIFAVGDPSLAAYPPTKRQQTQVLQHRPSNALAPAASDVGLPKRQNPVALLNARGPEIRRGYDLRETSGMGTRKSCQTERRSIGGIEPFGQVINTIGTAPHSIVRRYMWITLSPLLIEPGRSHQRRQGSEYSGQPVVVSPHWPAAIMILRKLVTAQAGEDRSGYEAWFPYPKAAQRGCYRGRSSGADVFGRIHAWAEPPIMKLVK
jgi:hypothetical protein